MPTDALRRNPFEQRAYIESIPLKCVHELLKGHLAHIDEVWEHEGVSACYHWTQNAPKGGRRETDQPPVLTDKSRLDELKLLWLAVFPCVGANEGHYVHVDAIVRVGGSAEARVPLFLIKTFSGQDMAIKIAGEVCRVLGV